MAQLRFFRNEKLQSTDNPWGIADFNHPEKQSWINYRQELRDITKTAAPYLDENDLLQNVTWPLAPNLGK